MAKAILIIDMPNSCAECRLFGSHYSDMTCRANGRSINYPYPKEKKQEWCPLREAPKKIVYTEGLSQSKLSEVKGYNACIDEILGGASDEIQS